MRVDLHCHSTVSDGVLSPAALVDRAATLGVQVLALTDHDTLLGLPEARIRGQAVGVEVLSGVEISASGPRGESIHILGYLFREDDPRLLDRLGALQGGRDRRNEEIARRLGARGMPLTIDEVRARAGGTVGRPHFAELMVAKGYVRSLQEAFERWLGDGCPAYVDKEVLSPAQAIAAIHDAGGVAALAHPLSYGRSPEQAEKLIRELAAVGLDGLEVFYGKHTPGEVAMLRCFNDRYRLLALGGSDYHREPAPPLLGLPAGTLEALRARALRWRVEVPS